jgi:hypothetical protein
MPRGSAPGERRGGRRKGTPNRRTVLFEEAVTRAEVSGDGDAVDFLTRIYRDPEIPLSVRIDCAKVGAPFERPRLTAMTNRDGGKRDAAGAGMPPLTIEHQAEEEPGGGYPTDTRGRAAGYRPSAVLLPDLIPEGAMRLGDPVVGFSEAWRFRRALEERGII